MRGFGVDGVRNLALKGTRGFEGDAEATGERFGRGGVEGVETASMHV